MFRTVMLMSGLFLLGSVEAHDLTVKMALFPASSFEAKTSKMKGEVKKEGSKYTAENLWVKVEELKTDITLRDEHFQKHLQLDKHPKITLTKVVAEAGKGTGTLTVNGIPKPVTFTYKEAGPKKLEALMKVKASDFKLGEAKYMGVGVEDQVEITAVIEL